MASHVSSGHTLSRTQKTYFLQIWSPVGTSAPLATQWKDLTWLVCAICTFSCNCINWTCCLKGCRVRCWERMIEAHDLSAWCRHQLVIRIFSRKRWLSRYNGISQVGPSRVWVRLLPSDVIIIQWKLSEKSQKKRITLLTYLCNRVQQQQSKQKDSVTAYCYVFHSKKLTAMGIGHQG